MLAWSLKAAPGMAVLWVVIATAETGEITWQLFEGNTWAQL